MACSAHIFSPRRVQAVAWLLSVPGASRTVLDIHIPYSRTSLADVLGKTPQTYASAGGCSAQLARVLRSALLFFLAMRLPGTGDPGLPADRQARPGGHTTTHAALLPCLLALAAETAREMAVAAYRRAAQLSSLGTDIVGVSCTCALATDREKRGEHKAYISTYSGTQERRQVQLLFPSCFAVGAAPAASPRP